jgi:FtsH-binding integral membrane protein
VSIDIAKIGFKDTEKNGTIAFLFWFYTILVGFTLFFLTMTADYDHDRFYE